MKQEGAVLRKCTFGMVLLLLLMLVVQLKLEDQRSRSTRGGVFDSIDCGNQCQFPKSTTFADFGGFARIGPILSPSTGDVFSALRQCK